MILYNNNEGYTNMRNSHFEAVKEFMVTFGQPVLTFPSLPTTKIGLLRYNLIDEEASELTEAMEQDDLVEIADALADLLYVIYGAYASFGIPLSHITSNDGPWAPNVATLPNISESFKVQNLLAEELHELMDGYKTGEIDTIKGALNGLLFTVYQFSFECGIDIYKCFDEVHNSNMSKACKTEREAERTILVRLNDEGNEDYRDAYVEQVGDYYIIKRASDSKALKGLYYYDPKLKDIL